MYTNNDNNAVGDVISPYAGEDTQTEEILEEPDTVEYEDSVEDILPDEGSEEVIEAPSTYNIDGEEVDLDTIRGWKNGNLRQSDYTRKTQKLAAERDRLKDASIIYEYLKKNPQAVQAIKNAETNGNITNALPSSEKDMINAMQMELQSIKTDNKVRELHEKYGDFDEDTLFRTANERGVTDLEIVLQSMLYSSTSKDAIKAAKEELLKELEANKEGTKTIVKNTTKKPKQKESLSAAEKRVAKGMGLSESDYIKWKG